MKLHNFVASARTLDLNLGPDLILPDSELELESWG